MEQRQDLWRGVIGIVVVGIALGIAFNGFGQISKPPRGVAWIGEPREVEALEAIVPTDVTEPEPDPEPDMAAAGSEIEMSDPLGVRNADVSLLDKIPSGRPLQVQLPAVKRFYDADAILVVDAREPIEYEEGHIAGAINLPYEESVTDPELLETLDSKGRAIVVYCGGGTCELSLNLGYALSEAGHPRVLVFMGGYPEWVAAGYPVETGTGAGEP